MASLKAVDGVEHQLEKQGKKFSLFLLNSESIVAVEGGSRGARVTRVSDRGTTLPWVKVPKNWLSVNG
jgi:hypothetical protein